MTVTTQDLLYFGTYWQFIQASPTAAPITLGNGYQNAVVTCDTDLQQTYFGGTVEKVDATGKVTDVIVTFAGADGVGDLVGADLMVYLNGALPYPDADRAAAMFEAVWDNPLYADARIHVTGHSLGAAFTQYVLGYSLATHGDAATTARADFTQFGSPAWEAPVANHFGLQASDFDGHITGYLISNDQVAPDGPAGQMGVINYLAPYQPYGSDPGLLNLNSFLNGYAAHWPTAYAEAIGTPSWLSAADTAHATQMVVDAKKPLLFPDDPHYGPVGGVSTTAVGDNADNNLFGTTASDHLFGGGGADHLTGGLGADFFTFNSAAESPSMASHDVITDFSKAQGDKIDLRGMNADLGNDYVDNLHFIGSAAFTAPNQIRAWNDGTNTFIQGDIGQAASAGANFTVELSGVHNITATDFMLHDTMYTPHFTGGYIP